MIDKLITSLPETIRAMSEPLSKVDKITVVSTGGDSDGGGLGINRVTSDMTQMIAQVPALLEALTGMRLDDLMKQVPELNGARSAQAQERQVVGSNGEVSGEATAANKDESRTGRSPAE